MLVPGFPKGISGPALTDLFREQSIHHGTTIHTETISKVDLSSRPFKLYAEYSDAPIFASSLIIATGATARRIPDLPGEAEVIVFSDLFPRYHLTQRISST